MDGINSMFDSPLLLGRSFNDETEKVVLTIWSVDFKSKPPSIQLVVGHTDKLKGIGNTAPTISEIKVFSQVYGVVVHPHTLARMKRPPARLTVRLMPSICCPPTPCPLPTIHFADRWRSPVRGNSSGAGSRYH